MLKIIVTVVLLFSPLTFAAKSTQQCEKLISKKYKKYDVRSVRLLIIGIGDFATHYNYEVQYWSKPRKSKVQQLCTDIVYCADYDNEVHLDKTNCER